MMIKEYLSYNPLTGVFSWIKKPKHGKVKVGDVAGHLNAKDGYIRIQCCGVYTTAQRLAWYFMTGEWPSFEIDHENNIRHDNKWNNLRRANSNQNKHNSLKRCDNTSGVKGVDWDKRRNMWRVRVKAFDKRHHVGYFTDIEEAEKAATQKRNELHGEFSNIGV